VQGKKQPQVEEKYFQARKPIRDRPAANRSPFRLSPVAPAQIGGETLEGRYGRVKARQEVKAVVGQPHAETKRDEGKGKARGGLQPGRLELGRPTADRRRGTDKKE